MPRAKIRPTDLELTLVDLERLVDQRDPEGASIALEMIGESIRQYGSLEQQTRLMAAETSIAEFDPKVPAPTVRTSFGWRN